MVLRLEVPLLLQDLTLPLEMAGSARVKHHFPTRFAGPLIVMVSPDTATLAPTLRDVEVTLANAGSASWSVTGLEQVPAWLGTPREPLPWHLPAGGAPHTFHFPLAPRSVRPVGPQPLRLAGEVGAVEFHLSLSIPNAGVPWPEAERICLNNPFTPLSCGIATKPAVGLVIHNVGAQPLACRIDAVPRGLQVAPDRLNLAPGGEARLSLSALPDLALLTGSGAAITLRGTHGDSLCTIVADIPPVRDEAVPVLASPGDLDLGSHPKGRRLTGHWQVENRGTAPAVLQPAYPPGAEGPARVQIASGSRESISVTFDTDAFPGGVAEVPVETGSRLQGLERLALKSRFQAVDLSVSPGQLDFGDVPFGQTAYQSLEVTRSDGQLPRLEVTPPPELAGLVSFRSGRVSFYNDKKAPEKVEGQLLTIRESSLNLTVTVPVTARCLTPRLLARRLLLTLVPGCSVTERLPLVAEGGRVTVTRATVLESGCHWLNVSVSSTGESVIARVTTRAADRGRLTAQVELRTNIPRGQPVLAGIEVQLTPTWRMRLSDAAARTWQRLREAFRRLMHLPGARHRP